MSELRSFQLVRLEDAVDILDHLRVPVNGTDRLGRTGAIPYYGANGLQGWIDRPLFNEPLILLAEDGGNFDDFSSRPIAYRVDGPSWVNNHAHIIRAKNEVSQSFIFWSIVHKDIRKYIAGGTRTKLTQGELRRIEINLPAPSEQQKIAQVLDTLDTAIHETETIIAKLKAVKLGLLQDLLTRGIDANGELRPPQAEVPQIYKQSTLGWIPRDWKVETLGKIAQKIQDGTHFSPVLGGGDYLYVTSRNVRFGYMDITEVSRIDKRQHSAIYRRCDPKHGDLLITKDGANTGNAALNICDEEISLLSSIAFLRFDLTTDVTGFFLNYILSPSGQQRLKDLMSGNAITRLTLAKIRAFLVTRPSREEQQAITETLDKADCRVTSERTYLNSLRTLKAGLLDDLLTGRVRVTPLLTTEQQRGT